MCAHWALVSKKQPQVMPWFRNPKDFQLQLRLNVTQRIYALARWATCCQNLETTTQHVWQRKNNGKNAKHANTCVVVTPMFHCRPAQRRHVHETRRHWYIPKKQLRTIVFVRPSISDCKLAHTKQTRINNIMFLGLARRGICVRWNLNSKKRPQPRILDDRSWLELLA